MDILLTACLNKGLFVNGLQQNIIFLAELLKKIGHNSIIAINHDVDLCKDPPKDILIIEESEILDYKYDYILQTGFVISNDTIKNIKTKNPNTKNIHIHYGNRMLADIEQCKWDTRPIDNFEVDEVWISPHYEVSIPYFKTYYNTEKVFFIPYIWSPKYIDIHERIWLKDGKTCEFQPQEKPNICILEPNLNMTKNCIPSIFICEELFRFDPNAFNELQVYCSTSVRDKIYFKKLMWNLDIQKNRRVAYPNRTIVSKIFSHENPFIVSHQLMNGLNYTYLEALHFNIPLIHNSKYIKNAGYYYPEYDTKKGFEQLKFALSHHSDYLESYKKSAQVELYKYSPDNPEVIDGYKRLLK